MNTELILNGITLQTSRLSLLNEELTQITNACPYDSYVYCDLRNNDATYTGVLSVASTIGTFYSRISDKNLSKVLDSLFADLRDKLSVWKRERFA